MKNLYKKLAVLLSEELEEKPYIDVSKGSEVRYAVSKDTLRKAVYELQEAGYTVTFIKVAPNLIRKFLSKDELKAEHYSEIKARAHYEDQ